MMEYWGAGALGFWCTGTLVHIVVVIVNSNVAIWLNLI